MDSVDIAALIAEARTDRESLGRLLERYRSRLRLDAWFGLSDQAATRHSPEDVVQTTIMEALVAFDRFKGQNEASFAAWLLEIQRCNVIDLNRKYAVGGEQKGPREHPAMGNGVDSTTLSWLEPAADQSTASQRVVKGEMALRLADILMSLPQDQREAVGMRHLEGCSIDEIARRLDRQRDSRGRAAQTRCADLPPAYARRVLDDGVGKHA